MARSSSRDSAGGALDRLAGRVLEAWGALTGSTSTKAKGRAARGRGRGRAAKARVKRARPSRR
jgi:uncharacterized protein YjbJ (UPF0337 family)